MRPTIEPSTALGLPRRSWWRSGSSSMRSSSIASRSAAETGVANGSTPASSASSWSSFAHRPWKVVTAGSSEAGRPSRSSIRSRSASAAGESTRMLSAGSASPGRSASHAKRSISAVVLPVPAPPMMSSGPPPCLTASCWAAESTSETRIRPR